MKKFLTTFDAAKVLNVSPGSVIRWIHEGKIAAAVTAGGHHRIRREEMVRMLKDLRMPVPEEFIEEAKIRILVVDDDPGMRRFIQTLLKERFTDILLDEAADGFTAGTKLNLFQPHIVVLDLKIPGLNGYKVCEYIRNTPGLSGVRVFAVSGLHDEDVASKIISLGANAFVKKPFDLKEFEQKMKAQIEAVRGERASS